MTTKIKVIRTCKETGKKEQVSMAYAIEKLSDYWYKTETLLLEGNILWTDFATYQIKK